MASSHARLKEKNIRDNEPSARTRMSRQSSPYPFFLVKTVPKSVPSKSSTSSGGHGVSGGIWGSGQSGNNLSLLGSVQGFTSWHDKSTEGKRGHGGGKARDTINYSVSSKTTHPDDNFSRFNQKPNLSSAFWNPFGTPLEPDWNPVGRQDAPCQQVSHIPTRTEGFDNMPRRQRSWQP